MQMAGGARRIDHAARAPIDQITLWLFRRPTMREPGHFRDTVLRLMDNALICKTFSFERSSG
jgi:hypothetical protein